MTQPLQFASFWERLSAFVLDVFFIVIPVFMLTAIFTGPILFNLTTMEQSPNRDFEIIYQFYKRGVFILLFGFAGISAVMAAFVSGHWQATPGKRIVQIYIARRNGSRITFADAFGRFISLPLFILMIKIFERREDYSVLDRLKASGKADIKVMDLKTDLNGPIAQMTFTVVFFVIICWILKIFFSRENTAMHDTLFNTRVFKGRAPAK